MVERTQMQHAMDPGDIEGQAETIERLTHEVERLRAALERIRDEWELGGACSAATATAALEQSAAPSNPDEGLPTADDVRGILKGY